MSKVRDNSRRRLLMRLTEHWWLLLFTVMIGGACVSFRSNTEPPEVIASGATGPLVCAEDESRCTPDRRRETCNRDRLGFSLTPCPEENTLCIGDGRCVTCEPGAQRCLGKAPQVCSVDGEWVTSPECGQVCRNGACATPVELALGEAFSCVLFNDGHVRCVGSSAEGQLGTGRSGEGTGSTLALEVSGLEDAVELAAGARHACARRENGMVACWGDNACGQLGVGDTSLRATPSPMTVAGSPLAGISKVTTSRGRTTYVQTDEGLRFAGAAVQGARAQCNDAAVLSPTFVDLGVSQKQLAGTDAATLVLRSDGTIDSVGNDVFGELGDGAGASSGSSLRDSLFGNDVQQVQAGSEHFCTIVNLGASVSCVGNNSHRQVTGAFGGSASVATPTTVVTTAAVDLMLALGQQHSCVLSSNGVSNEVSCWGNNADGQCGADPAQALLVNASVVIPSTDATKIAAGAKHTCLLFPSGRVACFGSNDFGQLGNGSQGGIAFTPVDMIF